MYYVDLTETIGDFSRPVGRVLLNDDGEVEILGEDWLQKELKAGFMGGAGQTVSAEDGLLFLRAVSNRYSSPYEILAASGVMEGRPPVE